MHLHKKVRRNAGFVISTLLVLLSCTSAWAQISSGGTPASFESALSSQPPTQTMPAVDVATLLAEDEAERIAMAPIMPPLRMAYGFDVNWNLNNSGIWETLPSGERVWRLRVECPEANAMFFWFNEWNIPKGARLFIYTDDHSDVRGAFTAQNNWVDGTNAIAPISGSALTLEYNIPPEQPETGVLSIGKVQHVYKGFTRGERALDDFGDAQSCNININCPEGANWQDEKHAVAMIVDPVGGRWCTGTLVRNLCDDLDRLFMTADHCLTGNTSNWTFIFNYEAAGCPNPGQEPSTAQSVVNATLLMSWPIGPGSDMALLRLSSNPPGSYNPYIAGWSRVNVAQTSSVGIHHGDGDIKKIYGDNNAAVSDDWNNGNAPNTHWKIEWDYGAMCYGSSGSACFDQNSRTKGPLTGGYPCCDHPSADEAWYGKISLSWAGGGAPSSRLSDWMDPCGNGATVVDGMYPPAAFNDNCSNAYYVGAGVQAFPFSHASNTLYSLNDYTATACASGFPGLDNVYYWYSTCPASVSINVCNSNYDTGLYVREATCTGTQVACDDDACVSPNSLGSSLTFNSLANTYYYIFVDGYYTNGGGTYTLEMTGTPIGAPPANDQCAGSLAINATPYTHSGNTCTAANNRVNCIGSTSNDVFYTLNLATCQTVTVTTCDAGTSYDTAIEVLTGGACPGTTQVACNDDDFTCGLNGLFSRVSFVAVAGQNYYIVIHGYSINAGAYTMNVTGTPFTPANDECAGSTVIAALPYTDSGNTLCANVSRPNCIGGNAPDVYYSYTSPSCQQVTTSLCGSGYDTRVEVRAGGACPGDFQIGCNDDFCGLQSQLTFDAAQGVTYYIIVNGWITHAGPFVLNVTGAAGAPSNDLCAGAKGIFALPYDDIGSTACATSNYTSSCAATSASNDVVYRLNIGTYPCQNVRVTGCGSFYDASLHVYSGSCDGTEIACNDDALCGGGFTLQPTVVFAAAAFTDYWIVVDGYSSGNIGTYFLHAEVTCEPESLVVQRLGATNDIRLSWKPLNESAGEIQYRVYRSNTFGAGYLQIAFVNDTTYTDPNRVLDPATQSFYYVTSEATPFLTDPGDAPVASVPERKLISPEEQAAMDEIFVPAYIDPADIEGPNPNKPPQ